MARFNLSPSVRVTETDDTTFVQEKGNFIGGLVGTFNWGPVDKPILVTNGPKELVQRFWKPTNDNYSAFCVAEDFLSYTNKMWVYRASGAAARNATPVGTDPVYVRNAGDLAVSPLTGTDFIAKYPGSIGNGLIVDIADKDKFPTWEFKKSFDYEPQPGEYHVVVVDGSGKWTSAGATKQVERLVISGKVEGGVKQVQSTEVTGTAAGGVKQRETITVAGTATGNATLVVDGHGVAILSGDSASTIATKIGAVLGASTGYESALVIANKITVVFANPGSRAKIADVTSTVGVTASSAIVITGDSRFAITFQGKNIYLTNGDSSTVVAQAIYNSVSTNPLFTSVSVTGSTITYTWVAYGPHTVVAQVTTGGVLLSTDIITPGDDAVAVDVFGETVAVKNNDSAAVVATKIAAALSSSSSFEYTNIYADRSSVAYTHPVPGLGDVASTPADQAGLVFDVDISTVGRSGTLLEKFELLTNVEGSTSFDGTTKYFVDAINQRSQYISVGDEGMLLSSRTITLQGGIDDNDDVNTTIGYTELGNAEKYNINYLIAGDIPAREQKVVFNVAETRRDCIGFVAPQLTDVVNNKGNELADILEWRTVELNKDSTYMFTVDNWGYYYDRYNDKYRWIPATGGTAGIKAWTDTNFEAWTSPGLYDVSQYRNYNKMAWSATQAQRDELYPLGVNSIVTFLGDGIRLFGDRTTISRPSAFRNLTVRCAFIIAEKSIADFSRYYLFKNNSPFTRMQFLNAVRPFLRNMQTREAFERFDIICDESNNDATVRQNNEMVAKFLIVPMYSINFIHLDFNAVSGNVSFEEIESAA